MRGTTIMLTRYWIEFAPTERDDDDAASSLPRTCGVTAPSLDDALALVRTHVFHGAALPPVQRVMEGVDTGVLAMFHVGPYGLPPDAAGVWYPPIGVVSGQWPVVSRIRIRSDHRPLTTDH